MLLRFKAFEALYINYFRLLSIALSEWWDLFELLHFCILYISSRSLCQAETPGQARQENRQEEEDQREDGKPESLLQ